MIRIPSPELIIDELRKRIPPVTEASFIVYQSNGSYYAKSGSTGEIILSGTDASEVIQGVINMCSGGEMIVIKKGLYVLHNLPITIDKDDIVLVGERGAVLKRPDNFPYMAPVIKVTGNRVTIYGLEIDGNRANNRNKAPDIYWDGIEIFGSDVIVMGCYIHDVTNHGIITLEANGVRSIIVNNVIHRCGTETDIGRAIDIHGLGGDIVAFNQIVQDKVTANDGIIVHGIRVGDTPTRRVAIIGNSIRGGWNGIGPHTDLENVAVIGNVIEDVANNGIGSSNVNGLVISDNIIYGAGRSGINLSNVNNALVKGNIIRNVSYRGIESDRPTAVIGNLVENSGNVGIGWSGGLIKGNMVINAGNHSIATGSNGSVIGNYTVGGFSGVLVRNSNNVVVRGNMIRSPSYWGIYVLADGSDMIDIVIEDNKIDTPTYYEAIRLHGTYNINAVIRNNILPAVRPYANTSGGGVVVLRGNINYRTENSGVATLPAGQTRVTVPHFQFH